jgi:primosomal protein N''
MSGEIEVRKGNSLARKHRPSWQHHRPVNQDFPGDANAQLEMLESIRNVLEEGVNLQRESLYAIREVRQRAERTRIAIERIDRRLAKVEKLR